MKQSIRYKNKGERNQPDLIKGLMPANIY